MAALVLVIAVLSSQDTGLAEEHTQPGGALFRLLAAGLVAMVVASIAPRVAGWMPGVEMEQVWGGLILIGIGLLHLGLTAQPLRVVLGLLTVLSGFEILYRRGGECHVGSGPAGRRESWAGTGGRIFAGFAQFGGSRMSAPVLWILVPGVMAVVLFFLRRWERLTAFLGVGLALILSGLAAWLNVGVVIRF